MYLKWYFKTILLSMFNGTLKLSLEVLDFLAQNFAQEEVSQA